MRFMTIFEAMASPSSSRDSTASPPPAAPPPATPSASKPASGPLKRKATALGDASGRMDQIGMLFQGLPPAFFCSTVPDRHVQEWIKHGGLLQTSADPEIWIFANPSRQGMLLSSGDDVNLGQPCSGDRKHEAIIFSSSWVSASLAAGCLVPTQEFILYAGDDVQVEKLQVPPSRVGPARTNFSSLRGIAVNDFSSLADRALRFGCDEEGLKPSAPRQQPDVTLISPSSASETKSERKTQYKWTKEVDPFDHALAIAWLRGDQDVAPITQPCAIPEPIASSQPHSASSSAPSPNKVETFLARSDSRMSLQRLLNDDVQRKPSESKPPTELKSTKRVASNQAIGSSRAKIGLISPFPHTDAATNVNPVSMLDFDLTGLPHFGTEELDLALPDLKLIESHARDGPVVAPRRYHFLHRETGQVASHAGGYGVGWMDPKVEEKIGDKNLGTQEGFEGGERCVERFQWIFVPKV